MFRFLHSLLKSKNQPEDSLEAFTQHLLKKNASLLQQIQKGAF